MSGPYYCGVGADKVYGREIVEVGECMLHEIVKEWLITGARSCMYVRRHQAVRNERREHACTGIQ